MGHIMQITSVRAQLVQQGLVKPDVVKEVLRQRGAIALKRVEAVLARRALVHVKGTK